MNTKLLVLPLSLGLMAVLGACQAATENRIPPSSEQAEEQPERENQQEEREQNQEEREQDNERDDENNRDNTKDD